MYIKEFHKLHRYESSSLFSHFGFQSILNKILCLRQVEKQIHLNPIHRYKEMKGQSMSDKKYCVCHAEIAHYATRNENGLLYGSMMIEDKSERGLFLHITNRILSNKCIQ